MEKETVEPFTGLVSIIAEMQKKIDDYAKTPAANTGYLKKQQALINQLTQIADSLQFYDLHPCWTLLQQYMDEARKSDSSIESFQVNLNLKPVTNRISIIDINLF